MNVNRTEEENRDAIRHDLEKNLFIEAGAGAGKTTLLVDRAVERLCAGDVSPSQIVIITFTNAAASELYNRIVSRLRQLEKSDKTDPEKKKIISNSLKHIDQMTISTIHHFCNMMLGQRIFDAGLGMNAAYTEEDEMLDRKRRFIRDALSGKGESPEVRQTVRDDLDELKTVIGWNYKGYIENLFCAGNMSDREDVVYKVDEDLLKKDWGFFQNEAHDLIEEVRRKVEYYAYDIPISVDDIGLDVKGLYGLYQKLPLKPDKEGNQRTHSPENMYLSSGRDAMDAIDKALDKWDSGDQSAVIETLSVLKDQGDNITVFSKKAPTGTFTKKDGKGKAEKDEIDAKRKTYADYAEQAGQGIKGFLDEKLEDLKKRMEAYRAGKVVRLVQKLSEKYQAERDEKYISNDSLLYRTRDLLKNEQARKILADRYRYLFVDEYQDTDQVQTDIIWNLCRKEENPDQLRDGSLVIVGDPKQSIYRFRGADSTLFETMKERFEKLQEEDPEHNEVIALHDNYRSSQEIIEAVNEGFKDRYHKPAYEPMNASSGRKEAGYPDGTFHGIFQYQPEYEKADKNAGSSMSTASLNNKNYTEAVGRIIETLKNGDFQITERKDGVYRTRPIQYSDFLVLTWSKTRIPAIVDDLKKHDIPVSVLGSVDVQISPVERLVRIMEYLASPNDEVTQAAAAQALCGEQILTLSREDYKELRQTLRDFATLLKSSQTADLIEKEDQTDKNKEDDSDADEKKDAKARRKKILEENGLYDLAELVRHKDACAIVRYLVNHEEILLDSSRTLKPVDYYDQKKQLHNLAESMESQEIYDLNEAAEYLEDYFSGAMEHDKEAELVPDKDQVRIMNLHKAKGLQAPIVILLERDKKDTKNTFQKGNEIYMVAVTMNTQLATYANESEEVLAEVRAADQQDFINLQYVADTRAGEALIFLKKPVAPDKGKKDEKKDDKDDQQEKKDPLTDTLPEKAVNLTDVTGELQKNDNDQKTDVIEKKTEEIAAERKEAFDKNRKLSTGLYRSVIPSDFENAQTSSGGNENAVEKEERPNGAVFGTVMHRCFELFVNRRDAILKEADSSQSIQKIISQAIMENISDIPDEDVEKYQKYLTKVLTRYRQNKEKMDAIRNAKAVYTEFPFSYYRNSSDCTRLLTELQDKVSEAKRKSLGIDRMIAENAKKDQSGEMLYIHGACDLVLQKQDGSIFILDYKSDECHDSNPEDFREKKKNAYEGQLTLYRYAMGEVFHVDPGKIDAELYLVDIE